MSRDRKKITIRLSINKAILKVRCFNDERGTTESCYKRIDDRNEIRGIEDSNPKWKTYYGQQYIIRRQINKECPRDYFKVIERGKAEIILNGIFHEPLIEAQDEDWMYYKRDEK